MVGGSSATGAAAIQLLRVAYPSLPIVATSSTKHFERLRSLGATHTIDYKSDSVVADIKAVSPGAGGIDVIIDCVSAGVSQSDICDVLNTSGARKYAAVVTDSPVTVPDNVEKLDVMASSMFDARGGRELIPSLTKLVEDGRYKVPLPVKVVGSGLEELPDVLNEVLIASGEKLVIML